MIDGQSMFQSAVNSGNEAERVVVPARLMNWSRLMPSQRFEAPVLGAFCNFQGS